ncbi:MAG: transposase [Clostridiaceae bacterium]
MARQARQKDPYGTFHVTQFSSNTRNLFLSDEDRSELLNILKRAQTKFHFKLYAYCFLSENAYHLVMDVNGGDLSKIMKSINISYAMYVGAELPLFKDRYKSVLLKDGEDISGIVEKLHKNSTSPTLWNSYCTYHPGETFKLDWVEPLPSTDFEEPDRECKNCIETFEEALVKLDEILKEKDLQKEMLVKEKDIRNHLIMAFRKNSTLSLKELGMVFGGLSESTICKILNVECNQ